MAVRTQKEARELLMASARGYVKRNPGYTYKQVAEGLLSQIRQGGDSAVAAEILSDAALLGILQRMAKGALKGE